MLATIFASVAFFSCQVEAPTHDYGELTEKYVELWNSGRFDDIDDIIAEDFKLMEVHQDLTINGKEEFIAYVESTRANNPGFAVEVLKLAYTQEAGGSLYMISVQGPGEDLIQIHGVSYFQVADGKFSKLWTLLDMQHWYRQMGFTWAPPAVKEVVEE